MEDPKQDSKDELEKQATEPEFPEDLGFDTIGFDYNPDDLDKTPLSTKPLDFSPPEPEPEPEVSTSPTTAEQLATIMAEFGFTIPEEEPDLERLQKGLIGIDLGSSDAVVACFNEDGRAVVVANSFDDRATPSRLLHDETGEWLLGREARSLAPTQPDYDFGEIKNLFLMEGWSTQIKGESHSANDLLAKFVSLLLEDIGEDQFGFKPSHVALAAPVWFKPEHREALARAVQNTGLEVVGVTDELLAACVPYSLRLPDLSPRNAVVVDVGHKGTSVAFIECAGGDLNILCQAGLPDLGGLNWSELLLAESVRKFTHHHGFDPRIDATCMTDLNSRVEEAKKALTYRRHYVMPIQSDGKTLKVRFEREAFERASSKLLGRLQVFLKKVLEKSNSDSWESFDALVIAGGGARIPMVRQAIEECIGRKAEPFNVEENVSIGTLYWGVRARHKAEQTAREASEKQ